MRAKMALDRSPELMRYPSHFIFFYVAFREEFTLIICLMTDHNLENIIEKGHPRNISMKLFHYLTSGFREDFLRISSCPYSESNPHSLQPCLKTDQNFADTF